MLLPFNHDYPFTLHGNEELNFLVEVGQVGFIEILIRKCDDSSPILSYNQDYESFVKRDYENEIILSDESYIQKLIKIEKAGTFYINVKATEG